MRKPELSRGGEAGDGDEHVLLAHDQRGGVQRGQLEAVAMRDGVGRAGLGIS